jgi:hypothetical protein
LANENKLKKVTDESTILSFLSGAKATNAEVFLWKLIGGVKHLGQVRIESIRKIKKDFCITPAEGQDRLVQDLMGSTGTIDLYIPDMALLLRCGIKQTDAPYRYYLQLPSFVAQVDRRQHLRLNVQGESDVRLNFGKSVQLPKPMSQHFHKGCFDISSGGFSFLASKLESKFFQVGDKIPSVEIKAGDWSSKIAVEVAAIREIDPDRDNELPYKVWRISCKITQIDQIGKKYLEKFIFERIKEELHAINE